MLPPSSHTTGRTQWYPAVSFTLVTSQTAERDSPGPTTRTTGWTWHGSHKGYPPDATSPFPTTPYTTHSRWERRAGSGSQRWSWFSCSASAAHSAASGEATRARPSAAPLSTCRKVPRLGERVQEPTTTACGPTLPTCRLQQVGSYLRYTVRGASALGMAARDPYRKSDRGGPIGHHLRDPLRSPRRSIVRPPSLFMTKPTFPIPLTS